MTAYQMGYAARMAKASAQLALGRNPFQRGDTDSERWHSGWLDASQRLGAIRRLNQRAA